MATQADIDRLKKVVDNLIIAHDGILRQLREVKAVLPAFIDPPQPAPTPTPPSSPTSGKVLWQDAIQTETDWLNKSSFFPVVEYPVSVNLGGIGADARGASLSRVRDPAGGTGWAIRHYVNATLGGRAQYSMASWTNPVFGAEAAKGQVWIEQEMFFPVVPTCNGSGSWLSLMDFHSHRSDGGNWWNTNPGLMMASEATRAASSPGRIVARDKNNLTLSPASPMALPTGRWFKLLTHFIWSTTPAPTTFYVDGVKACEVTSITKASDHTQLEWMSKLYGGNTGAGVWTPNPLIHYTRNVKITDGLR